VIAGVVPWSAGVFTDLSAAQRITGPSATYAWPDVDRFGITASIGWRAPRYTLGLGGALKVGTGNALVVSAQPDEPSYAPSRWHERSILFFVSGYQRAAEELAKSAAAGVLK
jgi:hypothetical protein